MTLTRTFLASLAAIAASGCSPQAQPDAPSKYADQAVVLGYKIPGTAADAKAQGFNACGFDGDTMVCHKANASLSGTAIKDATVAVENALSSKTPLAEKYERIELALQPMPTPAKCRAPKKTRSANPWSDIEPSGECAEKFDSHALRGALANEGWTEASKFGTPSGQFFKPKMPALVRVDDRNGTVTLSYADATDVDYVIKRTQDDADTAQLKAKNTALIQNAMK